MEAYVHRNSMNIKCKYSITYDPYCYLVGVDRTTLLITYSLGHHLVGVHYLQSSSSSVESSHYFVRTQLPYLSLVASISNSTIWEHHCLSYHSPVASISYITLREHTYLTDHSLSCSFFTSSIVIFTVGLFTSFCGDSTASSAVLSPHMIIATMPGPSTTAAPVTFQKRLSLSDSINHLREAGDDVILDYIQSLEDLNTESIGFRHGAFGTRSRQGRHLRIYYDFMKLFFRGHGIAADDWSEEELDKECFPNSFEKLCTNVLHEYSWDTLSSARYRDPFSIRTSDGLPLVSTALQCFSGRIASIANAV